MNRPSLWKKECDAASAGALTGAYYPSTPDAAARPIDFPTVGWRWIVLPAVAALTLCAYGLTGSALLNGDCFAYAQVAQRMLSGDRMYIDVWQDKPPLAILFYLVPQVFAAGSAIGIQAWLGVWLLLQVGVVAALNKGRASFAQLSVAAGLLLLIPLSSLEFAWASTENISNLFILFILFASYQLLRTGTTSAGVLVGSGISLVMAFNTRQNTVVYAAVVFAAVLLAYENRRQFTVRLSWIAAGIAAGWLLVFALVTTTSDLASYVDTVFHYPRRYAASAPTGLGLFNALWLLVQLALQPLGLILAVLVGLNLFDRWSDSWKMRAFLALVVVVGLAQCVLPLKPYGHYWANLIPLMALLGWAYLDGGTGDRQRARTTWCAGFCLLFAVLAGWNCIQTVRTGTIGDLERVVAEVDAVTAPGNSLYVASAWDQSAYLSFAATAQPASRFFWCMQLDPYWCNLLPVPIDEVLSDYQTNPPTIIVAQLELLNGSDAEHANKVNLVRQLADLYAYETIATVSGHRILKRKGS